MNEYLRAFSHGTFLDSDSTWANSTVFRFRKKPTAIEDSNANELHVPAKVGYFPKEQGANSHDNKLDGSQLNLSHRSHYFFSSGLCTDAK